MKSVEPGDRVLIIGTVGLDVVTLPQEKELCLTKEANLICVWKETDDGDTAEKSLWRVPVPCDTPLV